MFYVRSPLRITFGGGGSDLPWYYKKFGGYVLTTAIDKNIHLFGIKRVYDKKIWLSYSKNEVVDDLNQVKNEIIKECFKKFKIKNSIELHTLSDVPGNSGLGSSGAFISAILKFCSILKKKKLNKYQLASLGCELEMKSLKKNSGLQDQFISVFGGFIEMKINKKGIVKINNLNLDDKIKKKFINSTVTFYTKITRDSEEILKNQKKTFISDKSKELQMHKIVKIGKKIKKCLLEGNVKKVGKLFNEHWLIKKCLSKNMSNKKINQIYEIAMKTGAYGGKIIGAGGGGYLMFVIDKSKKKKLINNLSKFKLPIFKWNFVKQGTYSSKESI
tara:strand:- start:759 stop:1748 length:990 start_codon:yes stop_codon:yes gene_type:complete